MEKATIEFPHNSRTTYTAIKHLFEVRKTQFANFKYNDELFYIEARHGLWLSPFSEKLKVKVTATSSHYSKVVIESSSRSLLNILNFGANKGNISDLSDYISNEVYKLCQPDEIKMRQ